MLVLKYIRKSLKSIRIAGGPPPIGLRNVQYDVNSLKVLGPSMMGGRGGPPAILMYLSDFLMYLSTNKHRSL